MKKLIVFVGLVSLLLSSQAWGGYSLQTNVFVGSSVAYGAMGDARFEGSNQHIGCSVKADSYSSLAIFCSARNDNETGTRNFLYCYSTDWAHREAVMSMTPFSYVFFSKYADGRCSSISISNKSYFIPSLHLN